MPYVTNFDIFQVTLTLCTFFPMTEEVFFIFVKVVEPPSLLSSVFGALSMFDVVRVLVVLELYADDTS